MKLIAEQWICDQSPKGARLDVPESDARILIACGLARLDDDQPTDDYKTTNLTAQGSAPRGPGGKYARRDLKVGE